MTDMTPTPAAAAKPPEPYLAISASRHFAAWLADQRLSLAVTTYQAGRLLLFGVRPADPRLAITDRAGFTRCMGCCTTPADARTLYLATAYQIWHLDDALAPDQPDEPAQPVAAAGHDRLYVPRCAHTTGDCDTHDLAVDSTGRLVFANTRWSCLATLSDRKSFTPLTTRPRYTSTQRFPRPARQESD